MDADWWFLVLSFPPVLHWWKTDIITDEQRRLERDEGLAFIANVDVITRDMAFIIQARKGLQGIQFGNAYDRYGKPLPHLTAMYGLPWYR